MVGSRVFNLSVIFIESLFYGYMSNISSKKIESLGILNLKGPDSRNSRERHAKTPIRNRPIGKSDFYS